MDQETWTKVYDVKKFNSDKGQDSPGSGPSLKGAEHSSKSSSDSDKGQDSPGSGPSLKGAKYSSTSSPDSDKGLDSRDSLPSLKGAEDSSKSSPESDKGHDSPDTLPASKRAEHYSKSSPDTDKGLESRDSLPSLKGAENSSKSSPESDKGQDSPDSLTSSKGTENSSKSSPEPLHSSKEAKLSSVCSPDFPTEKQCPTIEKHIKAALKEADEIIDEELEKVGKGDNVKEKMSENSDIKRVLELFKNKAKLELVASNPQTYLIPDIDKLLPEEKKRHDKYVCDTIRSDLLRVLKYSYKHECIYDLHMDNGKYAC